MLERAVEKTFFFFFSQLEPDKEGKRTLKCCVSFCCLGHFLWSLRVWWGEENYINLVHQACLFAWLVIKKFPSAAPVIFNRFRTFLLIARLACLSLPEMHRNSCEVVEFGDFIQYEIFLLPMGFVLVSPKTSLLYKEWKTCQNRDAAWKLKICLWNILVIMTFVCILTRETKPLC